MISIIIPVYNAEKTLDRCIHSIICQSYDNWELLLVDDGSSDDSLAVCQHYAQVDKRIRVFHKTNGGASSARNIGLDCARGEWITFCDADDWVNSNWLKLFVDNIDIHAPMIVQGFVVHNGTWHGESTGIDFVGKVEDGILLLAQNKILGYLWTKLVRHDIIEVHHIRFNPQFTFREDEDFILRCMQYSPYIHCLKDGVYHYVLPDFSGKYNSTDNFYPFLSIFKSLKTIYKDGNNWLQDDYVKELTQSLFYSFQVKAHDRKQKLRQYKKEVGKKVLTVKGLSLISRYVIAFIPFICLIYVLLEVKERLNSILK